jgi:predicted MarR family transcription regulator
MGEPVISSAHLAGKTSALSEFEFSLNLVATAYSRWITRCSLAAGANLSALEVLIVHSVRHRDRPKRLAEIILVLDIEDTHLATYAIRKLERMGLLQSARAGKEKMISVTEQGRAFCDRYAALREQLLLGSGLVGDEAEISAIAAVMRGLSGQYNQAARAAATM